MEYMTPLQGFMATSIVTSDVDNATIVLNSQGQVTLNTNYPNMWQAIQTFLNTISFDPSAGDVPILVEGNMAGVSSITYDSGFIGYNLANEGEIDIGVVSTATSALNIYKLTGTGPYTISGPIFTIDNAGNVTSLSAAGAPGQGVIRAPHWNGSTWGLQIGGDASGVAAIMVNAPSGFGNWLEQLMVNGATVWHIDTSGNAVATGALMVNAPSGFGNWLEQLMVNNATMWHVDASGNAVAAGNVTGATLAGAIINSNQTLASFAGTSAGTVYWSMPFQGTAYKKVIIYFDGYGNTTTTAQTITYPVAFTYTPIIYNPNSVAGLNATITELAINPVSTSTYTGFVVLEGF